MLKTRFHYCDLDVVLEADLIDTSSGCIFMHS